MEVLTALGCRAGDSILDYGCSWGYGSWQLVRAGFEVTAFEISQERCEYARAQLQVDAHSTHDPILAKPQVDVFFSSHVLEHIPQLDEVIAFARRVLRPGGLFVAFTPNGSAACRSRNPESWKRICGFVHPLFLDDEFYAEAFKTEPHLIDSSPFDLQAAVAWISDVNRPRPSRIVQTSGGELMVAVQIGA